ncbi:MAG TPA: lipoyl(octanoyl) transferase LipB [Solirubrobacteraceae bacterium]|nr:lipoyl(octanoyl) transferase LipB [Solirubrobacteraceae bacterium]
MTVAERSANELWVCHLGVVAYDEALEIQAFVRARRQAGELPDTLLLLEHPPLYTRGRRSGAEQLLFSETFYRERRLEIFDSDRGGRITYHAPGQLVGYPIMAVEDVWRFVRTMEAAIVDALAQEGVPARARPEDGPDYTGVWVGERKIASIGVHIQRGVSTHGFAVNVQNDLEPFDWIVACGLPDVSMTSIASLSEGEHRRPDSEACDARLLCFRRRVAYSFARAHGLRQRLIAPRRLGIATTQPTRRASGRAAIPVPTADAEAVLL